MNTILLVEDDPDLIKPLKLKLQKENFKVLSATNGKEGWDNIQKEKIDCIILDIVMPETDGVWFLEKLRADPVKTKIPVIVFTNLSEGEKVAKAVSLGAYRLLVKADTSIDELLNTIREVIRLHS